MNFFETVGGRRFTEVTLPKLIKSIDRLADVLEKQNSSNVKEDNEEEKLEKIFNKIVELGGADASDEYSKGWDEAIEAVLNLFE